MKHAGSVLIRQPLASVATMAEYYVYAHRDPDGAIFYVGKGKRRRAYEKSKRSSVWKNHVERLGSFSVEILASGLEEAEAFAMERRLIAQLAVICNLTKGGEGSSGYRHTQAAKDAVGRANSGRPSKYKGVPRSDEVRAKLSESLRGRPSPLKGVTRPPEVVERQAATQRGVPKSAEARAKMAAAKRGTKISPETRAKIAASLKARYAAKA